MDRGNRKYGHIIAVTVRTIKRGVLNGRSRDRSAGGFYSFKQPERHMHSGTTTRLCGHRMDMKVWYISKNLGCTTFRLVVS